MYNKIPAKNFVQMIVKNIDNDKLSDEAFREFVRATLPIVEGGIIEDTNRKVIHVGTIDEYGNMEKHSIDNQNQDKV